MEYKPMPLASGSSSPCPLCRRKDGVVLYARVIHDSSILKCPHCAMIWTDPVPTMQELEEFYAEEVPDPAWDQEVLRITWPLAFYRHRLATIERFHPPGRNVLDVGVGFGHFMRAAREDWNATGIDISPLAARYVTEQHDIPIDIGNVRHIYQNTLFDCIHSKDVLEHIPDPIEELEVYRKLLRPGGILVIEMLNASSIYARVRGAKYAGYLPGHVVFFSPKTLKLAVEKTGFEFLQCWAGDEIPASRYLEIFPSRQPCPVRPRNCASDRSIWEVSFFMPAPLARSPPPNAGPLVHAHPNGETTADISGVSNAERI